MKKRLTIVIISTIVLVLLAAGVPLYFYFDGKNEGEETEPTIEEILDNSIDTGEIITNLNSGEIIRVSFKLQADDNKVKKEVEKRSFQIQNLIIKHLSGLNAETISNTEGKILLEDELLMKINLALADGEIVKVYITSFIVQ